MGEPSIQRFVEGGWPLDQLQSVADVVVRRVLGRVRTFGTDGLPTAGPLLLAMNHCSMLDGPLICGLVRRPVSCLVKSEAFVPGVGWLLRQAGQIAVVRDRVDRAPVRRCLEVLRAGGVVGIFPEGTRGDGSVRQAKPGVGYLALRTGAAVVPIACHGSAGLIRTARRTPVSITIGSTLRFPMVPADGLVTKAEMGAATETIRAALAELVRTSAPDGRGRTGTLGG